MCDRPNYPNHVLDRRFLERAGAGPGSPMVVVR